MKKTVNILCTILMALCAVCFVWVNLTFSINAGNIVGTILFGGAFCALFFRRKIAAFVGKIWRHIIGKIAVIFAGTMVLFCAGVCVFFGVNMARYAETPSARTDCVIVLGCQVRGEIPSRMLSDRLNTALEILNDEPQAVCVVSGGKGRGEDISEAEAMRRYLTARGISEDRIIMEDASTSTAENLRFSAEILRGIGITENVTIVTSDYHQFRAHIYAAREGLTVSHHSSHTTPLMLMNNAVREMCAIAAAYIGR